MRQIFNCLKKASFVALMCTIFLALASSSLHAQTITGNIGGTVTDSTGAVVPNASIEATAVDTGVVSKTTSNTSGYYNIRFLPIGNYKVAISAEGFGKRIVGPFRLEIGQDAKVDVVLKVGTANSTVEVTSDFVPLMNTENSTIASTLDSNTIESVALNGRNFSSLTVFLPGAVMTSPSGMTGSNAGERDTGQDGQTSVNGNRNQTNNYYLDGIEINETMNNVIGYNMSPDAIGEMKVISSNAPAEYGNVNGGDIIAVTKAGTNSLHGSAFYFLENWKLDANTWGNKLAGNDKTHYTQPIWGGTFGGPIKKNKLFFFIDYQSYRHPLAGQSSFNVATDKMRGIGVDCGTTVGTTGLCADLSEVTSAYGKTLYNNASNSSTTTAASAYTADSNGQILIPVNNPVAKWLFNNSTYYPAANHTASDGLLQNNYQGTYSRFQRNDQGDVRIDWTIGNKDNLVARWIQGEASDGYSKQALPIQFSGGNDYPTKGIAINEAHTFSSALVNEFRAGFTRVRWVNGLPVDATGQFGTDGDSLLGIGSGSTVAQPFAGFAAINFSSQDVHISNLGNAVGASLITDNTFQYGDNLVWMHGHHNLKGGFEITRYQQNSYYGGNEGANGQFNYNGNYTMNPTTSSSSSTVNGYDWADFLLDASSSMGQGGIDSDGNAAGIFGQRQYRLAFFAQDDWKFRPNLTFNIGIRYEYDQPIYEVNNKTANVNFADPTATSLLLAGKNGNSRSLYDATYSDIMPRVGFNYQYNPKTVIRGGFGITTYLEGTGANLRLPFNPPNWTEVQASNVMPTLTSPGTFYTVEAGFKAQASMAYRGWNNVKPSVVDEWSLATEYTLGPKTNLSVAYVGETGYHLVQAVAGNQLTKPCTKSDGTIDTNYADTNCTTNDPAPYKALAGQSGSIVETASEGRMTYHALQASLRQHATKGLEYTVNYSWAHSMTNSVGFYGVASVNGASAYAQNAYDNKAEYGPSGMDIRHNINGTAVYELPWGHGRIYGNNWGRALDEVAGGWKVSASAVFYTGFPVTINGNDDSATHANASRASQYTKMKIRHQSLNNWWGTDPTAKPCGTAGDTTYTSGGSSYTCAYGNAEYGTFGTASVGTERAPGFQQYDFSAYKDMQIWKDNKVTFRADFFNAFNISSYGNPDRDINSSTFGKISDVRSVARQVQFAVKYSF